MRARGRNGPSFSSSSVEGSSSLPSSHDWSRRGALPSRNSRPARTDYAGTQDRTSCSISPPSHERDYQRRERALEQTAHVPCALSGHVLLQAALRERGRCRSFEALSTFQLEAKYCLHLRCLLLHLSIPSHYRNFSLSLIGFRLRFRDRTGS